MTCASRVALILAMAATSLGAATASEPKAPQESCTELPEANRADCITADDLLAPLSTSPDDADLTVLMRADKGALTLEYHKPGEPSEGDPSVQCTVSGQITLPAGKVVHLEFISADVVYSFEVPGYVEQVDLVPGLVNSRRIETPAGAGRADGVFRADPDGLKTIVSMRFDKGQSPFDGQMLCAD
ncbi:hypothetical protein [Ensifer adhaerens]|uniref:hypothetical protein n=1 Tax=Ensifer adhaerens TaxID=106592 RepID=UPI001319D39E|nr:hypothetical protein [Ensifer adhaerens]